MAEPQVKLRDSIVESTKAAMRSKDSLRVSTLRLVSAAIKDRDIAARSEDRCDGIEAVSYTHLTLPTTPYV